MTEKELIETAWWWRKSSPDTGNSYWKLYTERIAWSYELLRRVIRPEEIRGFHQLNGYERMFLSKVSGTTHLILPNRDIRSDDKQKAEERGWTPICPMLQWNLQAQDHDLHAWFDIFIAQHRQIQNIPRPKKNQGIKRRPVSWKVHELLDVQDHKLKKGFDETDRSILSRGKREGKTSAHRFFSALQTLRAEKIPFIGNKYWRECTDQQISTLVEVSEEGR